MTGLNKPYPFGAFAHWFEGRLGRSEKYIMVSYAFNNWLYSRQLEGQYVMEGRPAWPGAWGTCEIRGAAIIPVLGDGFADGYMFHDEPPPKEETGAGGTIEWGDFCINRHNGGINMLFMDWSVRKVGLKELWTLKWSRTFDTAGPWTLAGGVKPEAWPMWMRRFKDY
jgi:prepilin-type processing-associated H-X9-DG protein